LNGTDVRKLESIGLAVVIDFRSDREIKSHPSCSISTVKETLRIAIHDAARDLAMSFLEKNDAPGLEKLLVSDYRRIIRDDSPGFREFFRIMKQATEFPLVYHCAAGKDRTGIASVLFLTALGVDAETVRNDYFLSNERLKAYADKLILKVTENGMNGEILRPMMEVRPEYLDAAFNEIDQRFGGMDNYLGRILDADIELLKNKYLE
jgi:protein-tyrosine phosphatase